MKLRFRAGELSDRIPTLGGQPVGETHHRSEIPCVMPPIFRSMNSKLMKIHADADA